MDFEKETVRRLKKYTLLKLAIDNNREKIETLKEKLTSVKSTTADKDPIKGGGTVYENATLNNLAEQELLEENIKFCEREVKQIDKALKVLEPLEKKIIEMAYLDIERLSTQIICEKLYMEKTKFYKIKNFSVRKITLALYGRARND